MPWQFLARFAQLSCDSLGALIEIRAMHECGVRAVQTELGLAGVHMATGTCHVVTHEIAVISVNEVSQEEMLQLTPSPPEEVTFMSFLSLIVLVHPATVTSPSWRWRPCFPTRASLPTIPEVDYHHLKRHHASPLLLFLLRVSASLISHRWGSVTQMFSAEAKHNKQLKNRHDPW